MITSEMIEKADSISVTPEEYMEMLEGPFTPVCQYPPINKYLDYEIGMFDGKRVTIDPFGHRNDRPD